MQVIVDGLLTSYDKIGSGSPLLFLHGWGDNRQGMAALAGSLKGKQSILLDLPGFGQTQAPQSAWGLDDYANFVKDFLAKTKLKPAAIIAHSNGGAIAIRGLTNGSLQTGKLILLASAGIRSDNKLRKKGLRLAAKSAKLLMAPLPARAKRKLRSKAYGAIGSDFLIAEHMQATFKKVVGDDVLSDAAKLTQPTLLIYGSADTSTPPSYGERFAQNIKNSDLKIVPGVGHFVHQESPDEVHNLVQEFLA